MLDNIVVFKQNSIKIDNIYIDPYGIDKEYRDAKYIFITHDHYDHYSKKDIDKVINGNTIFIIPESMKDKFDYSNDVIYVTPNNNYILDDLSFKTVNMYNIDKEFHKKESNWCGYIIKFNNYWYYTIGDSDNIKEINNINCDVVFIPIGGIYTMDLEEALECLKKIQYKYVIPVHYGSIVGDISLGDIFNTRVKDKCILKIK